MNLPEIYRGLEKELYNYCSVKSRQNYPERNFRNDYDVKKELNDIALHLELNYCGGERHLSMVHSPEKYFSIEITTGAFMYPGLPKVYYNFQMNIFNFLISKETRKIHRIDMIYPDREQIFADDLKKYAKNLNLVKQDLVGIYNWIKCINISMV